VNHFDLFDVDLQLIGRNLRQTSEGALPHFYLRAVENYLVVSGDLEPHQRVVNAANVGSFQAVGGTGNGPAPGGASQESSANQNAGTNCRTHEKLTAGKSLFGTIRHALEFRIVHG